MTLSRRELLSLLLGAPLAAQACRRRPPPPTAGAVRGGSMAVGHLLRGDRVQPGEWPSVERANGPPQPVRVAIVGSGAAGLSAAWRLQRLGLRDFVVFELENLPGGTSCHGTDGVVPYPWAAHYIPAPQAHQANLIALLEEIDAFEPVSGPPGGLRVREQLLIREPEVRLFVEGQWHQGLFPTALSSPQDRLQLRRFERLVRQWVAYRDSSGRRAFSIPSRLCSDAAEVKQLDRESAAQWFERHGFTSQPLRWYLEYACRDDYGATLEQTSAWALLFYFCARVAEPEEPSAPFIAWPEGNGRLVQHLANVAGPRLRTGRLVTDIQPQQDSVSLAVMDVRGKQLQRWHAEQVILAVPQHIAARVLRPFRERRPVHLDAFVHGAWTVANLHLRRRPHSAGLQAAWDSVLYDSPALGYVAATHQALRDVGPTVWTYYQPMLDHDPVDARRKLAALDHAAFCDAIVSDLGRAHHDLVACLERIDVWRWGHAMIRPGVGFIWSSERQRAARPLRRVHFAHSELSGLPLFEEAQDWGVRAAEAVARQLGLPVPGAAG